MVVVGLRRRIYHCGQSPGVVLRDVSYITSAAAHCLPSIWGICSCVYESCLPPRKGVSLVQVCDPKERSFRKELPISVSILDISVSSWKRAPSFSH